MAFFFEDVQVDVAARQIVRGDAVRRLTPRLLALLRVFLESGGRVVAKGELLEAVWNGRAVEEGNLNRAVSTLRDMLGDDPREARFIETVPRIGYRFIPRVEDRPIGNASVRVAPVGREAELATLEHLLDRVEQSGAAVALVSGEAGVGKTVLVAEFLSRLSKESFLSGQAACPERLAGTSPYATILELVRSVLESSALEAEAARAFPEYAAMFRSNRVESRASADERSRLSRALLEWLSRSRPLVLMIDDWHWADASSIDLFTWLTMKLRSRPILWVLAYRPTHDLLAGEPFRAARLTMNDVATDVELRGLPSSGIEAYLRRRFGLHDFPAELAEALFAQTEGNPMFLINLVDEMLRDGVIFRETPDEAWKLRHLPGERSTSRNIEAFIRDRMTKLSDVDRSLLEAACVQGMEFDAAMVASHCGMDPGSAFDRLIALQQKHGYVRWMGASASGTVESARFAFTHVLYQNALYELMGVERRREVSRSLASRLSAYLEAAPRRTSELAFLSREGEDYESAFRLFRDEAARAALAGGYREAIALANHALEIAPRIAGREAFRTIRLDLARYHQTLRSHHDLEKAITHCQDVLEVEPDCTEAQIVLASGYMLLSSYSGGPPRQLIRLAKEYAERVEASDPYYPELETVMGLIHVMYDWDWPAAEASLSRAIENNRMSGLPHQYFSFYWLAMGDTERALESAQRAREIDPYSPMIHSNLAWMHYFCRRYDASVKELESVVDRHPTFWRAYLNLGWALCQMKRHDEAMGALDTAVAFNGNPTIRSIQAYVYARAGREEEAKAIRARLEKSTEYVTPYWLAWVSLALGEIDSFFEHFEHALVEREFCLIFLNVEPAMDEVRASRRFKQLVERVGLPAVTG